MVESRRTSKTLSYVFLVLELVGTVEREIFDFLGYMWLPILGNFLNILFVIFGIFGVYEGKRGYLGGFLLWTLCLWIPWNSFLICYYSEAGTLNKEMDLLSFGTGSFSWWLVNGFGCEPQYFTNQEVQESPSWYKPVKPGKVEGCLLEYQKVEVTQAAIQLIFSLLALIFGSLRFKILRDSAAAVKKNKSMYSIEYSPRFRGEDSSNANQETDLYAESGEMRPHMTPRRVKRRSHTRSSTRSAANVRSANTLNRGNRATRSTRSAGVPAGKNKPHIVNPVNRFMEEAETRHHQPLGGRDSSTSNDDARYGQINPGFQTSRPNSLYGTTITASDSHHQGHQAGLERPPSALTSYSNFHGQRKPPPLVSNTGNHTVLTQESLVRYEPDSKIVNNHNNVSFDEDLPLPPPPISSSPTLDEGTSAAQVPVPQQRIPRKNEYVNMPVFSHQLPEETHFPHSSPKSVSPVPSILLRNNLPKGSSQYRETPLLPPPPDDIEEEGYRDTQTLRAETKLAPPKDLNYTNGYVTEHPHLSIETKAPELPARVPTGHQRRDRASLRAKHRRELEQKQQTLKSNGGGTFRRGESDDYGFTHRNNTAAHQNGAIPKRVTNGSIQGITQEENEDKWYLHDSMKPIGALHHGQSCQCYRCQRKLTAI